MAQRANGSVLIPSTSTASPTVRATGTLDGADPPPDPGLDGPYAGLTGPAAANTPFRFHLNSVSRTKSREWYTASYFEKKGRKSLREMQRTLHVGNHRHLEPLLRRAQLRPAGLLELPVAQRRKGDGVVIWGASMPGGNADLGPRGATARATRPPTRSGHWLSIRRTFQGSCGARNDFVTDIRDSSRATTSSRRTSRWTPAGSPGGPRDPVRNFMNYTDDPFMNQFTRGQRERMNTAWFIRLALDR